MPGCQLPDHVKGHSNLQTDHASLLWTFKQGDLLSNCSSTSCIAWRSIRISCSTFGSIPSLAPSACATSIRSSTARVITIMSGVSDRDVGICVPGGINACSASVCGSVGSGIGGSLPGRRCSAANGGGKLHTCRLIV